ncbi:MAG: hypothetical protein LBJ69_03545 [Holosporales bacterium]|jgi:hypothetical protein|nr:hypothetical protein [Holosporales bacterium]
MKKRVAKYLIVATLATTTGHTMRGLDYAPGPDVSAFGQPKPAQIPYDDPRATKVIDRVQLQADWITINEPDLARFWINEVEYILQRNHLTNARHMLEMMARRGGEGPNNPLMIAIVALMPETADPAQDIDVRAVVQTLLTARQDSCATEQRAARLTRATAQCITIAGRARIEASNIAHIYPMYAPDALTQRAIAPPGLQRDLRRIKCYTHEGDPPPSDPRAPYGRTPFVAEYVDGRIHPTSVADYLLTALQTVVSVQQRRQEATLQREQDKAEYRRHGWTPQRIRTTIMLEACAHSVMGILLGVAYECRPPRDRDLSYEIGKDSIVQAIYQALRSDRLDTLGATWEEDGFLTSKRKVADRIAEEVLASYCYKGVRTYLALQEEAEHDQQRAQTEEAVGTTPQSIMELAALRAMDATPGTARSLRTLKETFGGLSDEQIHTETLTSATNIIHASPPPPVTTSPAMTYKVLQHLQYEGHAWGAFEAMQDEEQQNTSESTRIPDVVTAPEHLARFLGEECGMNDDEIRNFVLRALQHLAARGAVTHEEADRVVELLPPQPNPPDGTRQPPLPRWNRNPAEPSMKQIEEARANSPLARIKFYAQARMEGIAHPRTLPRELLMNDDDNLTREVMQRIYARRQAFLSTHPDRS